MQKNKPFKIKIENFQSLSEADIELNDGLTIVTGTTNNGKTAIVRSVEAAVFNTGTDEFIKAGTDSLSVELDNGEHNVKYVRKAKGKTDKTTYQFDNGEVQQKVGRNQLPETEKLFNIREVRLSNNQRAKLNFWYQGDQPFLMDKTAGQLYEFLSISSSEKYISVLKTMLQDMKEEEADIKTLTVSIDTQKRELVLKQNILDQNRGFDVLYGQLCSLKKLDEQTEKAASILSAMTDVRKLSDTLSESIRRVTERIDAVPMERISREMTGVSGISRKISSLEKSLTGVTRATERLDVSKNKLEKVAVLSDESERRTSSFKEKIDCITALQSVVTQLEAKEDMFLQSNSQVKACRTRLQALPELKLSVDVQTKIQNRIAEAEKNERWLLDRRKQTTELMSAANRMKTVQDVLKSSVARLDASDKELDALKQIMGVCPFCGAVFSSGNNK